MNNKISFINSDNQIIMCLENQDNTDILVESLFSLDIGQSYKVLFEYDEECSDLVNSFLSVFYDLEIFTVTGMNNDGEKFTIEFEYTDRKYKNEEWQDEETTSQLIKDNLKNFNFEISASSIFMKYFTPLFNSYLNKYIVSQNLFICFSLLSNLLKDGDNIIFTIGDFEVKDITDDEDTEIVYGLDKLVRWQFEFIIQETDIFDTENSKLEYINNKIVLNLVVNKKYSHYEEANGIQGS